MGTVFALPVAQTEDLAATLTRLSQQFQVQTVAAHPGPSSRPLDGSPISQRCCLVFGSEGHGISPAVLGACSLHVAIPMARGVDSLNVASATAVFLYEAARRRGAHSEGL